MKVLVTGGTGVIGRAAVTELLRRGHLVRLLSRGAEKDAESWESGVEPFPGDVADAVGIRGAAEGCGAIVHIAGIVEESPPEVTYERINIGGTHNIVAEAERAGVRRLIFVSSLGAERGGSEYHRSKHAAEEVVRGCTTEWIILRPGSVFGPGDEAVSLLLRMVRVLPVIPVIERGDQPFQPIWHEDLAWAIAECVDREDLNGRVLDLAGPQQTTVNELVDRFAVLTDRNPTRLPLPGFLARWGTELASSLGVKTMVRPATITMLLEGNMLGPGDENGLTDVLGRQVRPIAERLEELAQSLPEQTPDEGVGKLSRRRFRVEIEEPRLSAREIFTRLCARLDDFVSFNAEAEPGSDSRIEPGSTLTLELPARGHVQVRVEEVGDCMLTLGTVAGHPLAGIVRMRLDQMEDDVVRFTIDVAERPATRVDQISMALVGNSAQRSAWIDTAERVVRVSGGRARGDVEHESWEVDEDSAESIEEWVRDRIRARLRTDAAERTDAAAGADGER